jgi:hypothetical protein
MMALDVLSSAVPPEMVSMVASKDTAKVAWNTIKTMQVGDDCITAAAEFKEEESIEDYSMRLSDIV